MRVVECTFERGEQKKWSVSSSALRKNQGKNERIKNTKKRGEWTRATQHNATWSQKPTTNFRNEDSKRIQNLNLTVKCPNLLSAPKFCRRKIMKIKFSFCQFHSIFGWCVVVVARSDSSRRQHPEVEEGSGARRYPTSFLTLL